MDVDSMAFLDSMRRLGNGVVKEKTVGNHLNGEERAGTSWHN